MGLVGKYTGITTEIVTQLKTITPELVDDTAVLGGPRVAKWMMARSPRKGRFECVVRAGPMTFKGGMTTKSSDNEFVIICDLIFYSDTDFDTGYDNVMGVAERIYDKVHLTTLNANCRNTIVEFFPGEGQISGRNLLGIPIRITVTCDRVISQT